MTGLSCAPETGSAERRHPVTEPGGMAWQSAQQKRDTERKRAIPCSNVATTTPALGTMVSMLSKSCTLSLKDLSHSEIAVELQ